VLVIKENLISFPVGKVLLIKRGGVPTHKIKVTASDEVTFTAAYVDAPGNGSVFTGEIWARQNRVLSLRQHDQDNGYVAFHVAIGNTNVTGNDYYVGSWYDVAGHHGLNFELDPLS
jgi:hypothetical protein